MPETLTKWRDIPPADRFLVRLHPDDIRLWRIVHKAAFRLAKLAKVPLRTFEPTPLRKADRFYGLCFFESHEQGVQLTLRGFNWKTKRWRRRDHFYNLATFLAHELAHLKVGPAHDHAFLTEHSRIFAIGIKYKVFVDIEAACV